MGHRSKFKILNYKISWRKQEKNLNDLKFGRVLKCDTKSITVKENKKLINLTPVALKAFALPKHYYKNEKAGHRLSIYKTHVQKGFIS